LLRILSFNQKGADAGLLYFNPHIFRNTLVQLEGKEIHPEDCNQIENDHPNAAFQLEIAK